MKNILKPDFLAFALASLLVWTILVSSAGINIFKHNRGDQYTRQALAWQKGQLTLEKDSLDYRVVRVGDIERIVPWLELPEYKNKIYVSYPPIPTLIEFPLTLIFGLNTPNTLTLLIFTWTAMLLSFFILQELTQNRTDSFTLAISIFWGSQILYSSGSGAASPQGQLYGVFFGILAIFFIIFSRQSFHLSLSGLMLGFAVGCRPFYLFMLPFLLYLLFLKKKYQVWKTICHFSLGLIPVIVFLSVYNLIRFDSIIEFGHNYLAEYTLFDAKQFSFEYFSRNLNFTFINLPGWNPKHHLPTFSQMGTAVWLVFPLLPLGIYFFFKSTIPKLEKLVLFISILAIWFMLLLQHSNGWTQFGYRYSIDLVPILIYLLGRAYEKLPNWIVAVCMYGIIINVYGVYYYYIIR
jgi:hypothetical protein